MLEVRNISFSYGAKPGLKDVSFVVSPGEILTVLGGNGAGKTTLLRILAMVLNNDGGMVLLDGRNVLHSQPEIRHQFGYLPENPALYDDMTVKEYLSYRATMKGESAKRIRRRVDDAVGFCRISNLMRTPICTLSPGLRKRVALADALLLRPRVLLVDDFLSGLDCEMRVTMGEILSEAASFSAVVATGHELNDFVRWTTRFVILQDGKMSESVDVAGKDRHMLVDDLASSLSGVAK